LCYAAPREALPIQFVCKFWPLFLAAAQGDGVMLGVIQPAWDVEAQPDTIAAHNSRVHCFYYRCRSEYEKGRCFPGCRDWEGRQDSQYGDRIGLLLDLGQGSMTVYNDERLGVIVASGLSGPYCWAVELGSITDSSARIEVVEAPPPPTAVELAASKEWRRGHIGLPPTATDAELQAAEAAQVDDYYQ